MNTKEQFDLFLQEIEEEQDIYHETLEISDFKCDCGGNCPPPMVVLLRLGNKDGLPIGIIEVNESGAAFGVDVRTPGYLALEFYELFAATFKNVKVGDPIYASKDGELYTSEAAFAKEKEDALNELGGFNFPNPKSPRYN